MSPRPLLKTISSRFRDAKRREKPRRRTLLGARETSRALGMGGRETPDESDEGADVEAALTAEDASEGSSSKATAARESASAGIRAVQGVCRVCLQEVSVPVPRVGDPARTTDIDTARARDASLEGVDADDVVSLGCACSQPCHRSCMEAWTRTKGDRTCEICGEIMSSLREPPRRGWRGDSEDEIAVFVRPVLDEAGDHVMFALATPRDGTRPSRVFIRRFSTSDDDAGESPDRRGTSAAPSEGPRRFHCASECASVVIFVAVFILVFGGPGMVLAGIYLVWFLWLRAMTA